jgi:ABC-type phosphate transport system substrate-binding protein
MRSAPLLAALLTCAALPAGATDDFKVVAHAENPATELTAAQLSQFFLKKSIRWPDGVEVRPVEPATPRLRERFAEVIHEKSLSAIKSYWNQLIFSGRDVPPLEKSDDAAVLAYVRSNRGALGYVSSAADTAGVRVLAVKR